MISIPPTATHTLPLQFVIPRTRGNGTVSATSDVLGFARHVSCETRDPSWVSGFFSSEGRGFMNQRGIRNQLHPELYTADTKKSLKHFRAILERIVAKPGYTIFSDAFYYVSASPARMAILNEVLGSRPERRCAVYFHDTPGATTYEHDFPAIDEQLDAIPEHTRILGTTPDLCKVLKRRFFMNTVLCLPPFLGWDREKDLWNVQVSEDVESLRGKIRHVLNTTTDAIVVLQPTRIAGNKGLEDAVFLASSLQNETRRTVVLVITGEINDQDKRDRADRLLKQAEDLNFGGLRFLDGLETLRIQMDQLYTASDLVTFMSTREGYGMPVLEAALSRVPLVTRPYTDYSGKLPIFDNVFGSRGFDFFVNRDGDIGTFCQQNVAEIAATVTDPEHRRTITAENYWRAESLVAANREEADITLKEFCSILR